ncbi:MAG: DUF5916 domain-containing protein [Bacteroidota bacterium]
MRSLSLLLLLLGLTQLSPAQTNFKRATALRITRAPKLDGQLNDSVWAQSSPLTDFIQVFPQLGAPAPRSATVRILYDNQAIYVGAELSDDPRLIRKQFTPRDAEGQADVDFFSIFFDTYNDKQNGFQFGVTPVNVQSDARITPAYNGGFGVYGDKTWDAVWDSRVRIHDKGWTVEMMIPYSALRFAKKDIQDWGIQALRFTRRNNERSFWNALDPQLDGFANQFGLLTGLQDIEPPLRLSLSPYVSAGFARSPVPGGFENDAFQNGGMDLKYGVNESFTLDMTLVPDFGQVISDNVINNLTPFEVQFQENRPFFTEGTELFTKAKLFYSRRVGATPKGYYGVNALAQSNPDWEIRHNPSRTQLFNAFKFSGRDRNKLGVGIFNAVTAPMEARLRSRTTGKDSSILTEPLANYNIVVLDQALKNRSSITFTNTNVIRNGSARDANVTGVDLALFDKKNVHVLRSRMRYSQVWGPVNKTGWAGNLKYSKVSGLCQYDLTTNIESKQYDPNDLGFLMAPNEMNFFAKLAYREQRPTKRFNSFSYSIDPRLQYLYNPHRFVNADVSVTGFWWFKNFWDASITSGISPGWTNDYFELRTPGRALRLPPNVFVEVQGSSDSRKKLFWRYNMGWAVASRFDNTYYRFGSGLRYRFSDRFLMELQSDSKLEENQLGYAFLRDVDGGPVVGFRRNQEVTNVLTGIYHFAYRLNLSLRVRHYWNQVTYSSFHRVDSRGDLLSYAFVPGRDDNVNLFNVDAFLTWDYWLGSRLIVGYKNWLSGLDRLPISTSKHPYYSNLSGSFDLRHGHEVSARFIYFLDAQRFRKRH